jgi:aldose 1-epimerase
VSEPPIVLSAGPATITVDPDDGARLTSFTIDGHELLHTEMEHGQGWTYGSFVMAPWAGRIRDGLVHTDGRTVRFPRQDDGHGLHGLVHSAPWNTIGPASWAIDLPGTDLDDLGETVVDGAWLAPIHVEQHLDLAPDRLELVLEVTAATPVPATIGWHPWFRRRIHGEEARIHLPASYMLARDDAGIATDRRVGIPPQPWDDAFGGLTGPIAVQWGEWLRLEIEHDGPTTVVYTGKDHAVCVEPQTGPPDEVNQRPRLAGPRTPLRLTSTWQWSRR